MTGVKSLKSEKQNAFYYRTQIKAFFCSASAKKPPRSLEAAFFNENDNGRNKNSRNTREIQRAHSGCGDTFERGVVRDKKTR